jgi:hypothetical protein
VELLASQRRRHISSPDTEVRIRLQILLNQTRKARESATHKRLAEKPQKAILTKNRANAEVDTVNV